MASHVSKGKCSSEMCFKSTINSFKLGLNSDGGRFASVLKWKSQFDTVTTLYLLENSIDDRTKHYRVSRLSNFA